MLPWDHITRVSNLKREIFHQDASVNFSQDFLTPPLIPPTNLSMNISQIVDKADEQSIVKVCFIFSSKVYFQILGCSFLQRLGRQAQEIKYKTEYVRYLL